MILLLVWEIANSSISNLNRFIKVQEQLKIWWHVQHLLTNKTEFSWAIVSVKDSSMELLVLVGHRVGLEINTEIQDWRMVWAKQCEERIQKEMLSRYSCVISKQSNWLLMTMKIHISFQIASNILQLTYGQSQECYSQSFQRCQKRE